MLTGPICSSCSRKRAAGLFFGGQLFAGEPHNLRIGAQHLRFDVDLGKATRFKMLQIGAKFGQFAREPRDLRATGRAPRARF